MVVQSGRTTWLKPKANVRYRFIPSVAQCRLARPTIRGVVTAAAAATVVVCVGHGTIDEDGRQKMILSGESAYHLTNDQMCMGPGAMFRMHHHIGATTGKRINHQQNRGRCVFIVVVVVVVVVGYQKRRFEFLQTMQQLVGRGRHGTMDALQQRGDSIR
jgi:hypothetical protein